MGGCRCTYRNCTIRTDGVTHMFHYPVFDKVRCHQWLTNAHKLNFLNLKVSQLKNRVVCQHHFRDENFMNFKKDKLTFDAVPTEDGPFCDSSQFDVQNNVEDVAIEFPISQDDIENEYLTLKEKKANFSVKYGDFLTNCELMDLNSTYQINDGNTQIKPKKKSFEDTDSNIALAESKTCDKYIGESVSANSVENSNNNILKSQPMLVVPPHYTQAPTVLAIEFEEIETNPVNENNKNVEILDEKLTKQTREPNVPANKTIRIITEKKISEPFPLMDTIKPLSHPLVLQLPEKTKCVTTINAKSENNSNKNIKYELSKENNVVVEQCKNEPSTIQNVPKSLINKTNLYPKSKSVLRNSLPAEKIAAIEEKRKFNMKLRDIVETCFDKLDESDKVAHDTRYSKRHKQNIGSQDSESPKGQELTMACLEARIKRMEDNLLSKIDQNSHKIIDLKKSLVSTSCKAKKNTFTQTFNNEESYKKHLYQEISKYLSPEANSLIYEELFINKYSQKVADIAPSPKRRKRR